MYIPAFGDLDRALNFSQSKDYRIIRSNNPCKKYDAMFDDGQVISFGNIGKSHYRDRTDCRLFKDQDTNDINDRVRYFRKHPSPKKYSQVWFTKRYLY